MSSRASLALVVLLAACATTPDPAGPLRAIVSRADRLDAARLADARALGASHVVLRVDTGADEIANAATRVRAAGMKLGYWIEVARCEALADARPELMASLQGHSEWKRRFPDTRAPGPGEVTKCWPWVPITSRAGFAAQLARVAPLLASLPPATLVLVNDLQNGPSACGCGNALCRWTSDYGERRTTTPLADDAAARFLQELRSSARGAELIPVWTTECEEADRLDRCAGVACFRGECW